MVHDIFGGGRSADVAKADEKELVGVLSHWFTECAILSEDSTAKGM
jgi:hypothetical protein